MGDIEKSGTQAADYKEQVSILRRQQEEGTFVPPTPEEEKKVIRKLDWRLLPLVFVLYSLAVLDRSNLGNARLAGMQKDIDIAGERYNLLGTIFYIAYILSQWTLIGWKQFPPHIFCAFTVVFWGFVASIQAAAFSWGGLMACRFFLGVAEAMFGPGVPLYLTYFYPRELVGFRHGVFISGAAIANAYGGALAYGISQIKGSLAPWRILFLIEGLPTLLVAVVAWFFLPDSISKARFLNDREKQVALHFVARHQRLDIGKESGVRFKEVLEAFKDPKSLLPGLMYFGCNVSFASLPLFLPTIISEMGSFSQIQSNGLSAPPYVLCFIVVIVLCWLSDHFKVRGPFVVFASLVSAVGFIINATTDTTAPRYASTFLSVFIFASVALLLAWTAGMHATESRRGGGFTILATIGQCGPLLGTNVFPSDEKPYYRKGLWISAAMSLMVACLAIILSAWIIWENKKLDREGLVEEEFDTDVGEEQGQRETRHRMSLETITFSLEPLTVHLDNLIDTGREQEEKREQFLARKAHAKIKSAVMDDFMESNDGTLPDPNDRIDAHLLNIVWRLKGNMLAGDIFESEDCMEELRLATNGLDFTSFLPAHIRQIPVDVDCEWACVQCVTMNSLNDTHCMACDTKCPWVPDDLIGSGSRCELELDRIATLSTLKGRTGLSSDVLRQLEPVEGVLDEDGSDYDDEEQVDDHEEEDEDSEEKSDDDEEERDADGEKGSDEDENEDRSTDTKLLTPEEFMVEMRRVIRAEQGQATITKFWPPHTQGLVLEPSTAHPWTPLVAEKRIASNLQRSSSTFRMAFLSGTSARSGEKQA